MSDDRHESWWHAGDDGHSDGVQFNLRSNWVKTTAFVSVWAGGELDPAYLSPAAARQAADEWPAILRRLADLAEGVDG